MAAAPEGQSEATLVLEGVSLSFGGIHALREVGFAVAPGAVHSIIGPNGAGKTSLLNCISGRYLPKGSIRYGQVELVGKRSHDRVRLGIGRTFQNLAMLPDESVLDNVLLGGHHRLRTGFLRQCLYWTPLGCRHEERKLRDEAAAALDRVGLAGRLHALAGELAYGEQKRLELARAILAQPRMLLLDEPMAGMSQSEKQQLGDLVLRLNREDGITLIMIEHDMTVIRKLSTHVVVLDFGRKIAEGAPDQVMSHPEVRRAYLGEED